MHARTHRVAACRHARLAQTACRSRGLRGTKSTIWVGCGEWWRGSVDRSIAQNGSTGEGLMWKWK